MLVRITFVAAAAALALPLLGGTAHASCLDDLFAGLDDGYTESPKSEYWGADGGHPREYVEYSGTANVTVHGDAFVSDQATWYTVDWPAYVLTYVENAPAGATTFVDCVAG